MGSHAEHILPLLLRMVLTLGTIPPPLLRLVLTRSVRFLRSGPGRRDAAAAGEAGRGAGGGGPIAVPAAVRLPRGGERAGARGGEHGVPLALPPGPRLLGQPALQAPGHARRWPPRRRYRPARRPGAAFFIT
eukprot:4866396-Pyramimonas_sp.AAC.1